jgi:hypothetical protein
VAASGLGRSEILAAVRPLLPALAAAGDDIRLVGTASSLLRGIDLPVADLDILARCRGTVDNVAAAAASAGAGPGVAPPVWEGDGSFGQYIAVFELAGCRVEVSTVEVGAGFPILVGECIRDWPWRHFDPIDVAGHEMRAVASELRLLSELVRRREDRWRPIAGDMARTGYDAGLLDTVLAQVPAPLSARARGILARG